MQKLGCIYTVGAANLIWTETILITDHHIRQVPDTPCNTDS